MSVGTDDRPHPQLQTSRGRIYKMQPTSPALLMTDAGLLTSTSTLSSQNFSPATFVTAPDSLSSTSSLSSQSSGPCTASPASSGPPVGGPDVEDIPDYNYLQKLDEQVPPTQATEAEPPSTPSASESETMNSLHKMFTVEGIGNATRSGRIIPPCDPIESRRSNEEVYLSPRSGDHRVLVVKGFTKPEQAAHDIALLSEMDYESVVNIYGCCLEPRHRPLLIYDFFSDKSLLDSVQKASMPRPLERVKIAADMAAALAYMHSMFSLPVIHRDVRSSLILLHVEDAKDPIFSLWRKERRELQANHMVFGANCFIDPDYHQLGISTCMSDVFSFGAFLVKLLTGEEPCMETPPDVVLGKHYFTSLSRGLDRVLAKVAYKCLSSKAEDRPGMADLAKELGHLVDYNLGRIKMIDDQIVKTTPQSLIAGQSNSLARQESNNSGFPWSVFTNVLSLGIHGRLKKKKIMKLNKIYETLQSQIFNQRILAQNKEMILRYWSSSIHDVSCSGFKIFSLEEVNEATSYFDKCRIIHKCRSTIYKGKLPLEEGFVAVKVASTDLSIAASINEISILLQIKNHRNVVKLLGCCWEGEDLVTVYEFAEHRSLDQHIFEGLLSFQCRLRIAADVAEALSYMHSSLITPIVHGDLRPCNVLLNAQKTALLSGFRTSKLLKVFVLEVNASLTSYYIDPEYLSTGQLTCQSDVYSFGVLLAQLLAGKETILDTQKKKDRSLASRFIAYTNKYRLHDILGKNAADISLIDHLKVEAIANIVVQCLLLQAEDRPTMEQVAFKLRCLEREIISMSFAMNDQIRLLETSGD